MHISSPAQTDPDVSTPDRRLWWLATKDRGGSKSGMVALAELEAGFEQEVAGYSGVEQTIFVLSGELSLETGNGATAIPERTALFVPFGTGYRLVAAGPVRLLQIYAGVTSPGDLEAAARTSNGGEVVVMPIDKAEGMAMNDDAMGMHDIYARMLVMAETIGSKNTLAGHSEYTAGKGLHRLHNHDHAGEFVFLLSGSGTALLDDGKEIEVNEGSLSFVPAGEWHGFRASGDEPVETIFAYAGVASFNDAGYALKG
jgi:mannose-6-phosphate isomerase-like protein (cupin superfamily)